jgi:hypothetical protein
LSSKPVNPRRKPFPDGILDRVEISENHWRLSSGLNKLRISGDIAQFRGDFAQAGPSEQRAASLRRVMEHSDV